MSTNYTGTPTATQSPAPQPGPSAVPIIVLPADSDPRNVATMFTQQYKMTADYLAYLMQQATGSIYGDGSDGAATLDGTATVSWATKSGSIYTLTRDVFLSGLTVSAATLATNGFRVFCTGTLTTASGGAISADGVAAVNNTGGTASPTGTVLGGAAGGAGNSTSGNAGSNATNSLGGPGGANGGSTASGGTVTQPSAALGSPRAFTASTFGHMVGISAGASAITALQGGAGGAGGGADGASTGGRGGGGGGVLCISARKIVCATSADFHATGGVGGAGSGGSWANGGGGGGGGVVLMAFAALTCASGFFSASVNCAGGAGGAKLSTGANGNAGTNGTLIQVILN